MDSIEFPEQTTIIAKDQPQYRPMPAHIDHRTNEITFCWQLTPEELAVIQATGQIWHTVLTFGGKLQPQRLSVVKPQLAHAWPEETAAQPSPSKRYVVVYYMTNPYKSDQLAIYLHEGEVLFLTAEFGRFQGTTTKSVKIPLVAPENAVLFESVEDAKAGVKSLYDDVETRRHEWQLASMVLILEAQENVNSTWQLTGLAYRSHPSMIDRPRMNPEATALNEPEIPSAQ